MIPSCNSTYPRHLTSTVPPEQRTTFTSSSVEEVSHTSNPTMNFSGAWCGNDECPLTVAEHVKGRRITAIEPLISSRVVEVVEAGTLAAISHIVGPTYVVVSSSQYPSAVLVTLPGHFSTEEMCNKKTVRSKIWTRGPMLCIAVLAHLAEERRACGAAIKHDPMRDRNGHEIGSCPGWEPAASVIRRPDSRAL